MNGTGLSGRPGFAGKIHGKCATASAAAHAKVHQVERVERR
jgi:hypothetical protein